MKAIKNEKFVEIIKDRIDNFSLNIDVMETGSVLSVDNGIARVYGTGKAKMGQIAKFENGLEGVVCIILETEVFIIILGDANGIITGSTVKLVDKILNIPKMESDVFK